MTNRTDPDVEVGRATAAPDDRRPACVPRDADREEDGDDGFNPYGSGPAAIVLRDDGD